MNPPEDHRHVPPLAQVVDLPRPDLSHSTEAEQSVLGGLLLDNTAWATVAAVVTVADFYMESHRTIYQQIADLIVDDRAADVLTVAAALEAAGTLAKVGGHAYLGSLPSNTPGVANIRRYAEIVRERARRRAARGIALEIADCAFAHGTDVGELLRDTPARFELLAGHNDGWPGPIDLAALAKREPQPPQFIVPDFLPVDCATLMAGHGGVGKSAVALHQAVCIALGLPWAGIECAPRRVLYLSCEDREGVLHWRLDRICRHLGVSIADLAGRLEIVELVGRDSILWERDPRTGGTLTPAYALLKARMKAYRTAVLFVDGVTDTFAGNENARGDVKRYVNVLLALVPVDRGALLLVGHVNRPTAANGATSEGYSGSTAWHNAVRSRLYLYPETAHGDDAQRPERTGRLLLELQKANHGPTDQTIAWRWDDQAHMFLPEPRQTEFDRRHRDRDEQRGILRAIKACMEAGVHVPAAMQGPRTAYHVLNHRPELPETLHSGRAAVRRFWRQVEHLRHIRHVEEREYRRANGHKGAQLCLTTEGERHIAA